jgi:hypothetical protein
VVEGIVAASRSELQSLIDEGAAEVPVESKGLES